MECSRLNAAVILISSLLSCVRTQGTDLTTVPGASGASVVQAVLSKLDSSGIFQKSGNADLTNVFLRNVAYVETRDGASLVSGGGTLEGGIWNMTATQLKQIQQQTPQVNNDIKMFLKRDWTSVDSSDLDTPLFSGMAARLYLTYVTDAGVHIPPVANQGDFWNENFKDGNGDVRKWIEAITSLQEIEICSINTDVVFVLDSSGSINFINDTNYDKIKNYTRAFVDALIDDGPQGEGDRVGIVIFGTQGNVTLLLSESENMEKQAILEHIEDIPYLSEWTNTADGLCKAIGDQPWRESVSVLRILITLTDGMSNRNSTKCGTTSEASELVHSNNPLLLSYAIGVANADEDELMMIASAPQLIDHLDNFDMELFTAAQEARSYQFCFTVHQPQKIGEYVEGTTGMGEIIRISFSPLTEEGITVQFCIHQGTIIIYSSTSTANPSSAINDLSKTITAGQNQQTKCFNFFFDSMNSPEEVPGNDPVLPTPQRKRQAEMEEDDPTTLYISIEGQQSFNQFSLNSTRGGYNGGGVGLLVILLPTLIGFILVSSLIVVTMFWLFTKYKRPNKSQKVLPLDHDTKKCSEQKQSI